MNYQKIDLTPEEEKKFEFKMYQYQGLQIAINQFLSTSSFEYNEEHYKRLTESYIEKYRLLTEYILELLKEKENIEIPVQSLKYEYTRGLLKVYLPQTTQITAKQNVKSD